MTTVGLYLTEEQRAALEKLYTPSFLQMLQTLRADEGDSVTLLADNGDGQPNNAIECCGAWTDWREARFTGSTLSEAMTAAYVAKVEATLTKSETDR